MATWSGMSPFKQTHALSDGQPADILPVMSEHRLRRSAETGWPQFGVKKFEDLSRTFNYLFQTYIGMFYQV